jgi:hypothetical protein
MVRRPSRALTRFSLSLRFVRLAVASDPLTPSRHAQKARPEWLSKAGSRSLRPAHLRHAVDHPAESFAATSKHASRSRPTRLRQPASLDLRPHPGTRGYARESKRARIGLKKDLQTGQKRFPDSSPSRKQRGSRNVPSGFPSQRGCVTAGNSTAALQEFPRSPLTDSNRRPPPYHRATRREARASVGHGDHEGAGNQENPRRASNRKWTRVPALVFPWCSPGWRVC